jgi:hypothetical protein
MVLPYRSSARGARSTRCADARALGDTARPLAECPAHATRATPRAASPQRRRPSGQGGHAVGRLARGTATLLELLIARARRPRPAPRSSPAGGSGTHLVRRRPEVADARSGLHDPSGGLRGPAAGRGRGADRSARRRDWPAGALPALPPAVGARAQPLRAAHRRPALEPRSGLPPGRGPTVPLRLRRLPAAHLLRAPARARGAARPAHRVAGRAPARHRHRPRRPARSPPGPSPPPARQPHPAV